MITAEEIIKAVMRLAIFAAEIYFIVWTIKNIRYNKKRIEVQKERINQLYRERDEDFKKMQNMQNRIEELEKQVKERNNQE